jgi:hypothetical protein
MAPVLAPLLEYLLPLKKEKAKRSKDQQQQSGPAVCI